MLTAIALASIPAIVPFPRSIRLNGQRYGLPQSVAIGAQTPAERNAAAFLQAFLQQRGVQAQIVAQMPANGIALVAATPLPELGTEGYTLHAGFGGVTIRANGGAGLFYGVQTLEQLMSGSSSIAGVDIIDRPALRWRGVMLDVSRHFYTVPIVEKYIDVAAHYKTQYVSLAPDRRPRLAHSNKPLSAPYRSRIVPRRNGDERRRYDD